VCFAARTALNFSVILCCVEFAPFLFSQPVDDEAALRTSPITMDDDVVGYDDDREIPGGLETGPATTRVTTGKKIKIREPSKLEQRIMAEARQRQRDNITKPQVVQGKEYKGSGFAAAPSTIEFIDFDVGVPMTKRFVLTNVSLTFNSFKSTPGIACVWGLFSTWCYLLTRVLLCSSPVVACCSRLL
jgi:hypothetical protein